MPLDQRLRDELSSSAGAFDSDTESALVQVVRTARHRRRTRRLLVAAATGVAVVLGGFGLAQLAGDDRATVQPAIRTIFPTGVSATYTGHAANRTVLEGTWRTSLAHGRLEVDFTTNGRSSIVEALTWKPGSVGTTKRTPAYPYRILAHHRIEIEILDPSASQWFSLTYRLVGDTLRLHIDPAELQRLPSAAAAQVLSWTSGPLTRVHA